MIDYHTHTSLCKHAVGTMDEYIESAIAKGVSELGISCHNPMPDGYDPVHRMTLEQFLEVYKPSVRQLQEKYEGKMVIKFGLEADYYPGTVSFVKDFIAEHGFDYVIGSVHYLGNWPAGKLEPVHHIDPSDVEKWYREYFNRVGMLASSGLCDIIAHFDLVKKNGLDTVGLGNGFRAAVDDALQIIKEHDLCVEINSSGLRKTTREVYPSESILARIRDYGIPLTTGSDAHKPEDVAAGFDHVHSLIDQYAGGRVCVFTGRKRRQIKQVELPVLKTAE
jgi:histidinol-phosphatase (PHP family)